MNKYVRIFLISLSSILCLVGLGVVAILTPRVQSYIAERITASISQNIPQEISIDSVKISPLGGVELKNIYLSDHKEDTLIYVPSVQANISLWGLILGKYNIKSLTVSSPVINVCRYQAEEDNSFEVFLKNFKKKGDKAPFVLKSSALSVENATLSYQNHNDSTQYKYQIDKLNIRASDILISSDTYRGEIETIDMRSNMGLSLKHFKGYFSYSPFGILVDDFSMQTGRSMVEGSFGATFAKSDSTLVQRVKSSEFNLRVDKSDIDPSEVAFFYPRLNDLPNVGLSTVIQGTTKDIEVLKLKISIDSTLWFNAYGKLQKGASLKQSKAHLIIANISTVPTEMYRVISLLSGKAQDKKLSWVTSAIQYLNGSGIVEFDMDKMNSSVQLSSDRGNISVNSCLIDMWDKKKIAYTMDMNAKDLNIGALMGNAELGRVTASANINGSGISKKQISANIKSSVESIELKGYNYSNINLTASYSNTLLETKLDINDPNLDANINVKLSTSPTGVLNTSLDMYLDKSNLNALGFVKDSSMVSVRATVTADIESTNINDMVGELSMEEISYSYGDRYYYIDRVSIESRVLDKGRKKLTLDSKDLFNGYLEGDYKLDEVPSIVINGLLGRFHSYKKKKVSPDQSFDFGLNVVAENIKVLNTPIIFNGKTSMSGQADSSTDKFVFNMDAQRINYADLLLDTLSLKINSASKNFVSIKANKFINSVYSLQNVDVKVDKVADSLLINSSFYKWDSADTIAYHINAYQREDQNGNVIIGFLPSTIDLQRIGWKIDGTEPTRDRLIWNTNNGSIRIDSLGIQSGSASFYINGYYTSKDLMDIKLTARAVDLSKMVFLKKERRLNGMLGGYISLSKGKNDKTIIPRALFSIDGISIDKDKIGDLLVSVDADLTAKYVKTFVSIKKDKYTSLLLTGGLNMASNGLIPDMNLKLDKLNISALYYLLPSVFCSSQGLASGSVDISGTLTNPNLDGEVLFDDTKLGIDFTKVVYSMPNGTVIPVEGSTFHFNKIKAKDVQYSTTAEIDGKIYHDKFASWFVDLKVKADNTLALNTSSRDNERFYGRLFGTGTFSLVGNVKQLVYTIDASLSKNSVFSIDIGQTSDLQASSMIQFVPPKTTHIDSLLLNLNSRIEKQKTTSSSEVNMNVRVSPDSQINVVLDKSTGHMIQANGSGVMRMNLSRKGMFDMTGTYELSNGEYTFVYRDLIKRPLSLVQGGKLIFDGDPSNPEIDFSATYRTTTKPSSYLSSVNENAREEVVMSIYLSNTLMDPVYTFGITMPKAPENVREELAYRLSDQEQLNQQFISLMVFNAFSNTGQDTANQNVIATGVAGITAGMLSSQFSSVIQRFVSGVDIDVNLGTGVNAATGATQSTDVEVGISTKLFNDRVTVNGVVGVPTGSTQSNLVGDVEIEYNISKDGRFRGVFVNRSQDDYMNNQQGYIQSIGVSYRQEFNTFKELGQIIARSFRKKLDKSSKGVSDKEAK